MVAMLVLVSASKRVFDEDNKSYTNAPPSKIQHMRDTVIRINPNRLNINNNPNAINKDNTLVQHESLPSTSTTADLLPEDSIDSAGGVAASTTSLPTQHTPANNTPAQSNAFVEKFSDIKEKDIFKVAVKYNSFANDINLSNIDKLREYKVVWFRISKDTKYINAELFNIINKNPSTICAGYIFQWIAENETIDEKITPSSMLAGTPIEKYTGQFLLFVDPSSCFLATNSTKVSSLYTMLTPIIHNYPSIYFLHKSTEKYSNTNPTQYNNMHYNLLLHQNIKYYGVVSLSSTISISPSSLLKKPKGNTQEKYSLDTLIIYSKHIGNKVHFFKPSTCFDLTHLDVSYNVWKKVEISTDAAVAWLESVTVRDIDIDLSSISNAFSTNPIPTQLNPDLVKNCIEILLIESYYLYKSLFLYSYPFVKCLHLHFTYAGPVTITYSHIYILMLASSFIFFNTSQLTIHLPAYTSIDISSIQQQAKSTVSTCNIEKYIKDFINSYSEYISNSSINKCNTSATSAYSIEFKKFEENNEKQANKIFFAFLKDMCNALISSGYVLTPPSLTTFTLTNGKVSYSFSVSPNAFLSISFESRAQSLSFRRFKLLGY